MQRRFVVFIIIVASFALAGFLYPQLPDQVASHWNAQGEVDGYMSKFWALFLMPFISVGLALLFIVIPRIDPLKENIAKFRSVYDLLVLLILVFLLYVQVITAVWNLGKSFNMTLFLVPGIAVLFFFLGSIMGKIKRNWFIGIRTPWTLQNDRVWEKTHRLGGKLFRIAALFMLAGAFFEEYFLWLVLLPVLGSTVYLFVYSYWEYRALNDV